ncbi:hypothetical protein [Pseudomonas fluorescens]|uniref:ATP-grasp domain-containing protein n=1 Tax=Pseudomonas fluorescens TaxID=294 RepID=A0A423LW42_PSEFL|nr:hypothetical protein [Pseudomonas fluorescens]RON72521.1 hypothetical protein BK671_01310 [Pseudomonas fluorescens]
MEAWPFEIIEAGKRWGFVDDDDVIILGAEQTLPGEMPFVAKKVSDLLKLLCSLPERFYGGSCLRLAEAVGCESQILSYLNFVPGLLSSEVYARADLFVDATGWKLLELNIGSSIGGMHMASLPRLAGYPLEYDSLGGWALHSVGGLGDEGKMLFMVPDSELERLRKPLSVLLEELSKCSSKVVSIASPSELEKRGDELYWKNESIKYLYFRDDQEAFDLLDARPDIRSLLAIGAFSIPMGPEYGIVSNKGALAILWDLCESNQLSSAEQALLEDIVPETRWLNRLMLNKVLDERAEWVLKPAAGFGGRGVICGCEVDQDQWHIALNEAILGGSNKYVLQRYINSIESDFLAASVDGHQAVQRGRVVWGPYIFGSNYLGTLVRAQSSEQSAVINYAKGAACGFIGRDHA